MYSDAELRTDGFYLIETVFRKQYRNILLIWYGPYDIRHIL